MSRRPAAAGVACLLVLSVAGCSGGSTGDDPSSSASSAPSGTGSTLTPSDATTPPASATATATATSSAAASLPPAPDPVVEAGNAGAWTLMRAAPGTEQSRQIPTLQCGQDGSVTADGLQLTAGARSLSLTDPAVTVTGTASLDAGGGTFRGQGVDTAVAFTWVC